MRNYQTIAEYNYDKEKSLSNGEPAQKNLLGVINPALLLIKYGVNACGAKSVRPVVR